jgi:hypothetical protein
VLWAGRAHRAHRLPAALVYAVLAGLGGVAIMGLADAAAATDHDTVRTWGQATGAVASSS